MKWTQSELEKLYQEVNAKAASDGEFRKALMEDAKAAMEKLAGRKLPDDFILKYIEKDNKYVATYVVPDFAQGELDIKELRDENLDSVNAGFSFIGIAGVCGLAVSVGDDDDDICGVNACPADGCDMDSCGVEVCTVDNCEMNAGGVDYCTMEACPTDACAHKACSYYY